MKVTRMVRLTVYAMTYPRQFMSATNIELTLKINIAFARVSKLPFLPAGLW